MSLVAFTITLLLSAFLLPQGHPLPYPDEYIVGGQLADIKDYPHQVSLQWMESFFCGGIIISDRWILTAAHCADHISLELFTIRAGSSYRDLGGVMYQVIFSVLHPSFNWLTLDNDVALLKVAENITFTDSIQKIRLIDKDADEIPVGDRLRVSGFGETQIATDDQSRLRVVSVPKISNEQCSNNYAAYPFPVIITENMLCAGFVQGGKGSCFGDSGGALVDEQGRAVGIVSWGIGCALPRYPGVYARISTARDFIDGVIGDL